MLALLVVSIVLIIEGYKSAATQTSHAYVTDSTEATALLLEITHRIRDNESYHQSQISQLSWIQKNVLINLHSHKQLTQQTLVSTMRFMIHLNA